MPTVLRTAAILLKAPLLDLSVRVPIQSQDTLKLRLRRVPSCGTHLETASKTQMGHSNACKLAHPLPCSYAMRVSLGKRFLRHFQSWRTITTRSSEFRVRE